MHFLAKLPSRSQNLIAWALALIAIALLGILRSSTEAEYAFASAVIIPVCMVAWTGGFKHGFVVSTLAVVMWILADLLSDRQFAEVWVPWVNGLTRLTTYGFVAYMTAWVRTLLTDVVELATRDALTGLLNRRAFFELGEAEVSRARRYGHPLAVIFLDLDNFKQLNDTQGHDAGDAALMEVAAALKQTLRTTDHIARLGGDEFAILLPEIGHEAATEAGTKIANAVATALSVFKGVSVSIGIAWFEGRHGDFPGMLKAADALMYEIKQSGKCGVRTQSFHATNTDGLSPPKL